MSRRSLSVEPPDLGLWPTAKGLAHLWREQKQLVLLGLGCALVYSGLALAIPIVIRHAIDNAIAPKSGHRAAIWPYLLAVLGLAILRFAFNFTRRYATARTGIRVEWRMRELLYQAYLRYPARVLRPARDRPGRVTRHERPLPHPLLHRLGHDAGDPVADDDRRDRGRPVPREREARRDRARLDAGRLLARVLVRAGA